MPSPLILILSGLGGGKADFGLKVFVDGVEIGPIRMGTLTWTDKLEARGPLRFNIKRKGPPPYARPTVGQTVEVFNNGTKIWSGTIDDVGENEPVKDAVAFFPIQAINHNQIMDRYVVVRIYDNVTAGSIIKDAITDFVNVNGENIDTSLVQDGPIIERAVFGYKTMTDVLRELSNISGFSWFVDCDLKLHFEDRATTNAPFGLFNGSKNYRKLKIKRTRGQYLNRAILRAGQDTSDSLQEDFAGDPGTKRQTFTVALTFASKPAVTLDTGGGPVAQTVGERGIDDSSAFQWFFRKGEKELSQRSSDTPISGTDVLSITYNGLFPIVQITEDVDQIAARAAIEGGGGVYERVEDDESIESRAFAIQKNEAVLRRWGKIPTKARYETDENGLFAGQLQNINLPTRGDDMVGNFLIEEVTARAIPGFKDDAQGNPIQVIRYQVKILSGEFLGGWVNFFKLWLLTGRSFKLNEEEVIVLVRSFTEGIEMAEAFNTVDALEPFPDDPFTGFQWGSAVEDRAYWGTLTDGTGFRQTTGSQWINPPVDA